jgi:general secretion pathway protein H
MSINPAVRHVETGSRLKRAAGFTLIEILVVLFIISIVSTVALLSINRNTNKEIETYAKQIAQMLALAQEQAMVQSNVVGLMVKSQTLTFTSLHMGDAKQKNTWQPLQESVLGTQKVPSDLQLKVGGGNASDGNSANPQIIISTNGDVTPFTIYIGKKGEKPLYAITGDADGQVTTRTLS